MMDEMERMIWSAAFVAEWAETRRRYQDDPDPHLSIDTISGFSCAEVANSALEDYREASTGDDREYLIPVKENWE